ncbi:permease [Ferrimonas marina]|uniref:Permease n=1 Tax=Ferrimonas marina TaxID=299255 RepID=A0A1M5YCX8_9GAMM|nr:permease [Ferrimonas marina]SHI09383.1 hypothetical protein SAMN02745129_4048 [Ferrimonas marina]
MSEAFYTQLSETAGFFLFLAAELTLLFLLISFIIGLVMEWLPAGKIQSILGSQGGRGYLSAGLLGALTPFCSCSTIPMLSGLLKARAGFGPTITFLFTSPLLNPIIIGLFWVTFGLKTTLIYFAIALGISVLAGFLLEKLGFEHYVRQEVVNARPTGCGAQSGGCGAPAAPKASERWQRIWRDTWAQFKKIFPLLMLGVAIGSLVYGFVPEDLIVKYASNDSPLSIAIASVVGVPLYIRAEAMIPLAAALQLKGMGMGALMALIIGSAGASITEVILLKTLFRSQMIIAFLAVIFTMAFSAGLLFSLL